MGISSLAFAPRRHDLPRQPAPPPAASRRPRFVVSFDFETELIARGRQLPPPVCMTWAVADREQRRLTGEEGIVLARDAWSLLARWASDPDVVLTGGNVAFDALVACAVHPYPDPRGPSFDEEKLGVLVDAYEDDRVEDLFVRQKLLDLAAGKFHREQLPDGRWVQHRYDLAAICRRMAGLRLDKGDKRSAQRLSASKTVEELQRELDDDDGDEEQSEHWRLRYAELRNVPLAEWPEAAVRYAMDDARGGALAYLAQERPRHRAIGGGRTAGEHLWAAVERNFGEGADPLEDQHRQSRSALWMRAMSAHGLVTDPYAVEKFGSWAEAEYGRTCEALAAAGLVRVERSLDRGAVRARLAAAGLGPSMSRANLLAGARAGDGVLLRVAQWREVVEALSGGEPEPGLDPAEAWAELAAAGLASASYHRNTKAAQARMVEACARAGMPVPRTKTYDPSRHGPDECVALDREACQAVPDCDELGLYAELGHLSKIMSADLPILRSGTEVPIHARFDELKETGRTGTSKPNIQNLDRGSTDRAGARECYAPRPGWVLIDSDYGQLELYCLAQAQLWFFGRSRLADVLRAGRDAHIVFACEILAAENGGVAVPYEEGVRRKGIKIVHVDDGPTEQERRMVELGAAAPPELLAEVAAQQSARAEQRARNRLKKDFDAARNAAKAVNFGRPGGLSAETMRTYAARSYGVHRSVEEWRRILDIWNRTWDEMPAYFELVSTWVGRDTRESRKHPGRAERTYNVRQPWSNRLRAGASYCAASNTVYQGLGADVAKRAGWYLFTACYLARGTRRRPQNRPDALYGSRPVNFVHDQFLIETREGPGAPLAAASCGEWMNRASREVCPDTPSRCEPALADRWSKLAADPLRDAQGRLLVWRDSRLAR